jgi:hypothetical protein
MLIHRSMSTFRRNMLSPWHFNAGKWRAYIGIEEGWLKERGQSERRIRGKRIHTKRSLQAGYRKGGCKKRIGPLQGTLEGVMLLLIPPFRPLSSRMRGFYDLLRDKPSSLLLLSGWSSMSIASLMIRSMHLDFLARILVLCRWIRWPRLMLCSATADFLGWYKRKCRDVLWPSSQSMYTFPH